ANGSNAKEKEDLKHVQLQSHNPMKVALSHHREANDQSTTSSNKWKANEPLNMEEVTHSLRSRQSMEYNHKDI
ncbi:hypothetical protein, partial [Streptococcus anginosus]|uniref:hypothetical protein n=1 Tax=Streptococcus anginosus TaxID=1328 RepID=UPI002EDA696E